MTKMDKTRLVQRLGKPIRVRDITFSFGGGMRNGGLSDDAMDLLRSIFSFDYMGAAEFEFGAVPNALAEMAKSPSLGTFSFDISLSEVAPNWRDKSDAPDGAATIYVVAPSFWNRPIEDLIRSWAAEPYNGALKETTKLSNSLRPFHEWDTEICGWLELNNGFAFFTDHDMYRRFAALFGVEIPELVDSVA